MDEVIEKLRNFKENQEATISNEQEKIIDVSFYGKINLSKNDADKSNEKEEDLYLVKKEVNGKTVLEFSTNNGMLATVNENGEIKIGENYKELINEKELLLQLQKVMPLSLEKLEEIEKNRQAKNSKETSNKENKQNSKEQKEPQLYKENAKDVKIDLNKKITETKTFSDLVPEVKEKGIIDVRVRRTDNTKFEFIGINNDGEEIELQTLQQTEGTNPNKDIIEVNNDGSKVQKDQVMTMIKIISGNNQGRQDEGFTVNLEDPYGTPEVNYYRRSREENEYTSIPVNLENTNQKRTELEVRQYMEKKRNTNVQDNIQRAEDRIEQNENNETELRNIDDDLNNETVVDSSEILIQKAAKRCKISVESFKQELEKADGNTLEEKIQETEENINDQFRGNNDRRA